jgi:hypothetical protein
MLPLIICGVLLVLAGTLIIGTKTGRRLELRPGSLLVKRIARNIGAILFILGIVCIVAGLVNLYYG